LERAFSKRKSNRAFKKDIGKYMEIKNSGRGHGYSQSDINSVIQAMEKADPYTQGHYQRTFEEQFSEYLSGNVASFAVSSGTAALELAAIISETGENDEVIIPAHTFAATAIPFARTGSKIVWADIDPNTFVISVESIKSLITPSTKVIVVVHLYGLMADMTEIMKIANHHGIIVVEDCAQALGAEINGQKAGTFGHFSCFSFHSHKHLTTLGEGGMFVLKDKLMIEKINGLKHNGLRKYEENKEQYWKPAMSNVDFDINGFWPYNFCLGEIQCAVGISLLSRINSLLQKRIERANEIKDGIKQIDEIRFQDTPKGYKNVHYTLPAFVKSESNNKIDNDSLIGLLYKEYNIKAVVQYYPLYRYPMFVKAGFSDSFCPNTDKFFDNMLALPNHDELSKKEINYITKSVASAVEKLRFVVKS
jgi:perosamine synthetase